MNTRKKTFNKKEFLRVQRNLFNDNVSILEERYNQIKSKDKVSSYTQVFGEDNLGNEISILLSAVQSTRIAQGYLLETLIYQHFDGLKGDKLKFDDVISTIEKNPNKKFLFRRVSIDSSKIFELTGIHIEDKKKMVLDFCYYRNKKIYIIETKDATRLDTKKTSSEIKELNLWRDIFTEALNLPCEEWLVCFPVSDINEVSYKSNRTDEYTKTGDELSQLLGLNYDIILLKKNGNTDANREFFNRKANDIRKTKN